MSAPSEMHNTMRSPRENLGRLASASLFWRTRPVAGKRALEGGGANPWGRPAAIWRATAAEDCWAARSCNKEDRFRGHSTAAVERLG